MNWMHYGWGMGFSWLFALIFFVVVIWLLFRSRSQMPDQRNQGKTAIDILKERYVKGEINKEEFEEKKKDIQ